MSRRTALLVILSVAATVSGFSSAEAHPGARRQYYSSWSYYPSRSYYYTRYYYKPTPTYPTYSYHYCVSYPSRPRYVYYYNPHTRQYWGRFDCEGKSGEQYSLLKPEHRKENLNDIKEEHFPKPGPMPVIPEATDGTKSDGATIDPIQVLPTADAQPDDAPAGDNAPAGK